MMSSVDEITPSARAEPGADRWVAIARIVYEELGRVRPRHQRGPLTPDTPLAAAGIDPLAFLDAVTRLEGRYQMRFRGEWLAGIRTCSDLIECIAEHMFDSVDRRDGTPTVGAPGGPPMERRREPPRPDAADPFPECAALEERLAGLAAQGLENPFLLANETIRQRTARIAGHDVINFTSFDYLGLAGHADVSRAAKAAIDRFGTSASASRMVGGNNAILDELDAELAAFIGTERAVVFPCGYGTNASVFNHLFGAGDLILYDELAHNSIVQGAGASKAGKRSSTAWTATIRTCRGSSMSRSATTRCCTSTRPTRWARWDPAAGGSANFSTSIRPTATSGWARSARPSAPAAATSPATSG